MSQNPKKDQQELCKLT